MIYKFDFFISPRYKKKSSIGILYNILYNIMSKTRCSLCKTANALKLNCKFCSGIFCTSCLMPEKHMCSEMKVCEEEHKTRLTKELLGNKCVKRKLEVI